MPQADQSPLRKLLPLTTVGVLIAAAYAGYTIYSRHQADAEAQRHAEEQKAEQERATNQGILQHGELTIVTFGASDAVLQHGGHTNLCYGVVNAKSVTLDPPPEPSSQPSYRHCMEIAPKKTTTYKLTATGDAGQTKTASITIQVR